jgi:hypothetical protein
VRNFLSEGQDMPLGDISRYIDEFADLSKKEGQFAISFTGGEPFLRYPDLLAAIRYAKEKGASQVSCVTNGFWGKDAATAQEWATELSNAGLHHICFSIDDFHQEYIPLSCVLTALKACRKAELRFGVKCVVTNHTRRVQQVLGDLGNLLLDTVVTIQEIACVPWGSAANRIPKDEWLVQDGIPQGPCPGIPMASILPDGMTFPCCGDGWTQRLVVGNARVESITELMRQARNRALFAALRYNGPGFFVPYFTEAGYPLPQEGYINHCHLCKVILEHPESERVLRAALTDWKIKHVEKCLGGLWKPDDAYCTKLRAFAGAEREHS